MAHLSGTYTYTFSRLDPMYNNSLKTGVQSLVVGLNCQYSGLDENGVSVVEGAYICLLYTSPSPRDKRQSRMPSSA